MTEQEVRLIMKHIKPDLAYKDTRIWSVLNGAGLIESWGWPYYRRPE